MTRTSHRAHATPAFPVYCLDWLDDDTLVLGGGGGATKSGIENKFKACKVAKDGRSVKYTTENKLSSDEDAPMTLAVDRVGKQLVTGINASSSSVQAGTNEHCRVYKYDDKGIELVRGQGTIEAEWSDDYPYQKLTAISPDSQKVAIGTTDNRVNVLRLADLSPLITPISVEGELMDLDWGGKGEWLAVTSTKSLSLYTVREGEKDRLEMEKKQTIWPPSLDISPVAFRAARFSPSAEATAPSIHAVLNSTKVPKKGAPRKSFVVTFALVAGPSTTAVTTQESSGKENVGDELGRWDIASRREVAGKAVTTFDISTDGKLLAYGCADYSVGILDSKTLAPLLKILHAHSFPPTALKFNPSATLLVSASADNTFRAIVVPASFSGISASMWALIIAILVILIALFLRR